MPLNVSDRQRLNERCYLAMCVVAVCFATVEGSLGAHGAPNWDVVAVVAACVALGANTALSLPSSVTVSASTVAVTAGLVALQGRGIWIAALVIGTCLALDHRVYRRGVGITRLLCLASEGILIVGVSGTFLTACERATHHLLIVVPATVVVFGAANATVVLLGSAVIANQAPAKTWSDIRPSLLTDAIFSLLGLVIGELYVKDGVAVVVIGVAMLVLAQIVFLAIVRLRHAYNRLDLLYGFTQRLERSQDERDAALSVLNELRSLLGASTAELTLFSGTSWRRTTSTEGDPRPVISDGEGIPACLVDEAPFSSLARLLDETDPLRIDLFERAGEDAMIVSVRADNVVGSLVVGRKPGSRPFTAEDLRLLEALASHAAVSLDNSRLLGQLRYDSRHDHLTDLPNRTGFNELVSELPRPCSVLLLDLDRFKEINDTLGHQHGDLLLINVARRLTDEVGRAGIVARLGGDEFGILLPDTGSGDAAQTAVALLAAVEQPFQIGELQLEITASIGVAVAATEQDGESGLLLQRADVAMYSAKEAHSGWELYSPERDHYSPRRLTLAGELRRAIDSGELEVHYQPKSELSSRRVCGLEALVRWRHPRYGMIGPDQFIPVAESAGLIRPLTAMVLVHSVRFQRELRVLGYDLDVAVNLSVRSVLDVNLPDQIAQVLADHGVSASSLTLEITEGSVMADPARTIGVLGRLSQLGVSISVDDFGTGYSSLSYLKRLPANEVKIDRTFVAGMLGNRSDHAIVQSTVDLARNLGLRVVAEGVEDAETWEALRRLGCDYAQGYFISPPLPSYDLQSWLLRTHPASDPLG